MRGYPHLAALKMFFFSFQTTNIFYSSLLFTNHLLKKIFLIIEIWNTNITKLRWILLSDQDLTLVPRLDNTPRQIDSMWVMRVKRDVQGWLKFGGLQQKGHLIHWFIWHWSNKIMFFYTFIRAIYYFPSDPILFYILPKSNENSDIFQILHMKNHNC